LKEKQDSPSQGDSVNLSALHANSCEVPMVSYEPTMPLRNDQFFRLWLICP
jgi:hypothetical protein